MTIFVYKTQNPARSLTIDAVNPEEADQKFEQMRDAAGLTADTLVESVETMTLTTNIVEHAELASQESESAVDSDSDENVGAAKQD